MNKFDVKSISKRVGEFAWIEAASSAGNGGTFSIERVTSQYRKQLERAVEVLEPAGMKDAITVLVRLRKRLNEHPPSFPSIGSDAATARTTVVGELDKRKFLFVAQDRVEFVDHERLFGDEVFASFPSARADIKEAGNCLASECCTASVFHLMRASEVALRLMCSAVGVSYPDASLSAKTVGDLLGNFGTKLEGLRQTDWKNWPSKDVKDAQIQFFHSALVEFRDFNEAWRKHMAHAHDGAFYDRDHALSIMNHVRSLMRTLASRISESTTPPMFWTTV